MTICQSPLSTWYAALRFDFLGTQTLFSSSGGHNRRRQGQGRATRQGDEWIEEAGEQPFLRLATFYFLWGGARVLELCCRIPVVPEKNMFSLTVVRRLCKVNFTTTFLDGNATNAHFPNKWHWLRDCIVFISVVFYGDRDVERSQPV